MSMGGAGSFDNVGGLVGNDRVVPGGSVTYSYRSSGATITGERQNAISGTTAQTAAEFASPDPGRDGDRLSG